MLEQLFKLPILLKEGLIIDIEATGDPSKGGRIITFGYCVDDFIEIFQLEEGFQFLVFAPFCLWWI